MKLEELKQGDTFFKVTLNGIRKYEYLMPYPFHNKNNIKVEGYHIVLDKNLDEPKRMYYNEIAEILCQKCFSYADALKKEIELHEKHLLELKNNL